MSPLSLLLNLLWIVFGGMWMAVGWLVAAVIMAITIIGLPWARAAFNIAVYTLLPFGQTAVSRANYSGREDLGTGPVGTLGNIIWFILAGWWLPLGHLFFAVGLAITILCLGASETRRPRPLAVRQDDRNRPRKPAAAATAATRFRLAASREASPGKSRNSYHQDVIMA
jgi:uncharacterized membrane protein YccF (DUF307 family)